MKKYSDKKIQRGDACSVVNASWKGKHKLHMTTTFGPSLYGFKGEIKVASVVVGICVT